MKLSYSPNSLYQVERQSTALVVGVSVGALVFVGLMVGLLVYLFRGKKEEEYGSIN